MQMLKLYITLLFIYQYDGKTVRLHTPLLCVQWAGPQQLMTLQFILYRDRRKNVPIINLRVENDKLFTGAKNSVWWYAVLFLVVPFNWMVAMYVLIFVSWYEKMLLLIIIWSIVS